MNNSTIKTELEARLVEFVSPAQADFSKQVSMTGTSFAFKYEKQHNEQEVKITHAYTIIAKTKIDVVVQIDEFINYWLNDQVDIGDEVVYPELINFVQHLEDTGTHVNNIKIQVYYFRQRQG